MTASVLLDTITAAGLTVTADGDTLVVRPRNRITPELRALIRVRKAELLALLPPPSPVLDATNTPVAPCPRCGGVHFWRSALVPGAEWRCVRCIRPLPNVLTDGCSLPAWKTGR